MRRIKMVLEYDGSAFYGFQRHKAGPGLTIQDEIESKFSRLLNRPVKTVCAGRTDAGVHATGQVILFETDSDRSLRDLLRGANAVLCDQVRVLSVEEVDDPRWHPRFTAKARTYHYFIVHHDEKEPFFPQRVWNHHRPLDADRMQQAADLLVGHHDFSAYCRGVPEDEPRRRNLMRLEVHRTPMPAHGPFARMNGMIRVEVEANAFLRRMVRMLVGNLAAVGRGEWTVERPHEVLLSQDPEQGAASAPPHGLYLVNVRYE